MSSKWAVLLLCAIFSLAKAQNGYGRDNPSNQLNYNPFGQLIADEDEFSGGEIPGEAGRDYPVYDKPPETSFRCDDQQYPGYYADPESQCQAFHICQKGGRGNAFLCPNGTVFNQEFLVCDWWYNFDCGRAEQFYGINEQIVRAMEEADERLRQQQGGYDYNAQQSQNGGYQNNGGYDGQTNGVQFPSSTYGGPGKSNGNGYSRYTQYSNGRIDQATTSSVYGAPGSGPSQFAISGGFNGFSSANGFASSQGKNYNRPSQNYGVPSFDSSQIGQRYNGNNFVDSPRRDYGVPENRKYNGNGYRNINDNGNGYKNGNNGNGYRNGDIKGNNRNGYRNENIGVDTERTYLPPNIGSSGNGYNGNGNLQAFRNGLGNGPSTPDRTYLPSGSSGVSRGNSQNGAFVQNNRFNGAAGSTGINGYNSGFGTPNQGRTYLPPSK